MRAGPDVQAHVQDLENRIKELLEREVAQASVATEFKKEVVKAKEEMAGQAARIGDLEVRLADAISDLDRERAQVSAERDRVKEVEERSRIMELQAAEAQKREAKAKRNINDLTTQLTEARKALAEQAAASSSSSTSSIGPSDGHASSSPASSTQAEAAVGRRGSLPLLTISSSSRGFRESSGYGDPRRSRWVLN